MNEGIEIRTLLNERQYDQLEELLAGLTVQNDIANALLKLAAEDIELDKGEWYSQEFEEMLQRYRNYSKSAISLTERKHVSLMIAYLIRILNRLILQETMQKGKSEQYKEKLDCPST